MSGQDHDILKNTKNKCGTFRKEMRLTKTTSCEKGIDIALVDDPKHMYMYH